MDIYYRFWKIISYNIIFDFELMPSEKVSQCYKKLLRGNKNLPVLPWVVPTYNLYIIRYG